MISRIKRELSLLSRPEAALLLLVALLILAERLYFTYTRPLHIDEAYTFINFTSNGIWQSMSYYPEPNNHILFSVITAFFYHLYPDMEFALRFPAFLISTSVTILLFFSVKRYAGFWVALLGIALFCFSNMALYYSFAARGYFLLIGFSFLGAFAALEFVRTGRRIALSFFCLAAVLGMYSIPIFVYPLASISLFASIILLVDRKYNLGIQLVLGGLLAGLVIIGLYMPVFMVSGVDAVFANEFVAGVSPDKFWNGFFRFIKYTGNDLLGKEYYGYGFGVLVTLGYLFYLGNRFVTKGRIAFSDLAFQFILLLFCLQLMPLLLVAVQQVFPPTRVFLYLSAFQFVGFAWLFIKSAAYLNLRKAIFPVTILLLTGYGAHQLRVYYHSEKVAVQVDNSIKNVVRLMLETKPVKAYMQHYFYEVFTRIAFKELGQEIAIDANQNFDPAANYEIYLLGLNSLPPDVEVYEIYRDDYVVVYEKR